MVIAVADLDGTIIGLRRMTDSTVFSIDVAATKARNMVYFNSASRTAADLNQVPMGTAVTNRTIGFGAQPLFPPGIDGSGRGPSSIYTRRMWRIPAHRDFRRPAEQQQKRHCFFSRAAWGCTAMAFWWADWRERRRRGSG